LRLRRCGAIVQLVGRSGAGARSFPRLVRPSKIARLMKSDSTKALGLHGFSVGSAPIGIVTVPPATGVPDAEAAVDAPGPAAPVHAETRNAPTRASVGSANSGRD